jgi:hypothetical protein
MKRTQEFENFDRTMRKLISVPHSTLKTKLDAEKEAKARKRKPKRTSASHRVSGDKD